MKLLVMGAGYVGMALLAYFQSQPHEIFIITTSKERIENLKPYGKGVLFLEPTDNRELRESIHSCDGMIILVAPKNSQKYEETYLNTAKRISSALKNRQKPFYILYTSSTSICEGIANEWVTEEMTFCPKSDNGKILLETEQLYLHSNANTCILRLGGIYGPKRELTDRARYLAGKELPGTGNEPTNHIHLVDIVAAIAFCLNQSLTGIYHVVNDEHVCRKELYTNLCQQLGIPSPTWNNSPSATPGCKVSNQKIKDAGFVFAHPFLQKEEPLRG